MAEIKKIATRESYGNALVQLGAINENIVVLDADLSKATKTAVFKKEFPERFINCGIAECNLIGVASGLSLTGKIPFASSFAMFLTGRAYEQIRNTVGYPCLNVKLAATHAGTSVGEDGATHQCNEDIALMRTIPKMIVINPSDHYEAIEATKAVANIEGPCYLRFSRLASPVFNDENYKFTLGKAVKLKDGNDVTIIATGLMVHKAMEAHELLKAKGINARVLNIHTIKPIDEDAIISAAKETGAIVTAEEHSIIGGLGSAVCDVVCENFPVPVIKLGINDVFGTSGPATELLDMFKLSVEGILEKVEQVMPLKK